MCVWEEQGIAKEPLSTTHDVEDGRSCTCREKSEIGSSLEASEHHCVRSGICLRRSWRVMFKMLYAEIELRRKKNEDNNMEKHYNKNFIEDSNMNGTYL